MSEQKSDGIERSRERETATESEAAGASPTRPVKGSALGQSTEPATTVKEWLAGRPLPPAAHHFFGLIVPTTLAIINMWRLRVYTVDDAYISYRYARNLARGLGLVYNEGERIEGYTNFLWTVLLAGGIEVGIDPDLLAKILGGACGCGCLVLTYLISARMVKLTTVPCIATWLLASTATFTGYSIFGLETSLFVFLVLAGTLRMMTEQSKRSGESRLLSFGRFPFSGLLFALAGLCRPEAPLYLGTLMLFLGGKALLPMRVLIRDSPAKGRAPVLFASIFVILVVLVTSLADEQKPLKFGRLDVTALGFCSALLLVHLPRDMFKGTNLLRGLLFVAPLSAHALWRVSYYGSWLPNTLAAKTGNLTMQAQGGLDYVLSYVDQEGPVVYLAVFGLGAGIAWRHRHLLAFGTLVALILTYVITVGGDWMPLFRFMAPMQPFLFLLICAAVRSLFKQRVKAISYGLLMALMLIVAQRTIRLRDARHKILNEDLAFWNRAAGGTVSWFRARVAERGDAARGKIALGDIGQIGYDTDFPVLDLLGLVDPVISQLPGGYTQKTGKGFRDRFFDERPRYFILISSDGDCVHPSVIGSRILFGDHRFRERYAESGRVKLDDNISWCIYENRKYTGAQQAAQPVERSINKSILNRRLLTR